MSTSLVIDGPNGVGSSDQGFGYDIRPGVSSSEWFYDDTYAWPISNKPSIVTLKPALLKDEWGTTGTGIYARDRLSHHTQSAGSWEEYPRLHSTDWVMLAKETASELTTITPYEAGAGIALHLQPFGAQLNTGGVAQITFGHSDPTKAYRLNVREDGYAFLARGNADPTPLKDALAEGYIVPARHGSLIGQWTKIFILPHGRNRILVAGSAGNEGAGFVWEDETASRADTEPSENGAVLLGANPATPSVNSFVTFPSVTYRAPVVVYTPPKSALQLKPLLYVPTGTMKPKGPPLTGGPSYSNTKTPVIWSVSSPLTGPSLTGITADRHRPEDIAVSYSPSYDLGNGHKGVTPTVTFSRPGVGARSQQATPILYRFEPKGDPTNGGNSNPGSDLTKDLIEFRHTHDKEGSTAELKIRYADQHTDYYGKFNVPFTWSEEGNVYFQGVLADPQYEVSGAQSFMSWKGMDQWRVLENVFVKSLGRFDGMTISDAVKAVMEVAGWPADGSLWDIDETPNRIHTLSKGEADSDPTNLPDVARTAAEWVRYIIETYTSAETFPGRWVAGFQPYFNAGTGKYESRFYFKNPDTISTTPVMTWYSTQDEATANGADWRQAQYKVYRKYSDENIEPEANDVYVLGMDDNGKGIFSHKEDKASIEPTTALGSRPSNWLGQRRQFVVVDTSVNTQALANSVCQLTFNRLSRARRRATIEAEWEPSVTLWRTVRLAYAAGRDLTDLTTTDWVVTGYEVTHRQDDKSTTTRGGRPVYQRPATYHLEKWS